MSFIYSHSFKNKADFTAYLDGLAAPGYEVIDSRTVGDKHWQLMSHRSPQGEISVFIGLCELNRTSDGWGHRSFPDSAGPTSLSCPVEFIERCTPPDCESARRWRERVLADARCSA